jgi:hypothetical protein
MSKLPAVVGAVVEIKFIRETEHPVQPLPCSQRTLGALGLARARSRLKRSRELSARVAEDAVQNLRKSRRDTFICRFLLSDEPQVPGAPAS